MNQFFVGISDIAWVHCLQGNILPKRRDRTGQKVSSISNKMAEPSSRKRIDKPVNRSYSPLKALLLTSLFASVHSQLSDPFPAQFELSSLDGTNGFTLYGEAIGDRSGVSVSGAGDVNGDGLDDILIGAYLADPSGKSGAGKSYVIFGMADIGSSGNIELSTLSGANGFVLNGEASGDNSGFSVSSAGDVNGDGISDLVIGAYLADPSGKSGAGKSYVIFGKADLGSSGSIDFSTLTGANGFVLNGEAAGDSNGFSVSSAGDVNGDGINDLVIGARLADPSGKSGAGKSYVIFGKADFGSLGSIDLSTLTGANGFALNGEAAVDSSGISVSSAGDLSGDGISDLVIGAYIADPSGKSGAGKSYVIFGKADLGSSGSIDLSNLTGVNGFVLNGEVVDDYSGRSVSSAGDVNGDGIDDLVIGAWAADPNNKTSAGKSYVIFGKAGLGSSGSIELSALIGTNGFVLKGEVSGDGIGFSVSSAGDVNGDGFSDLVIGATGADPSGKSAAGKCYVIFGKAELGSSGSIELSTLTGTNGFVLNGEAAGDDSGRSVSSAGDLNGDGIDDLVIGAPGKDLNGESKAGKSYVIFGRNLNKQILTLPPYMETTSLSLTTNSTTLPLLRSFQTTKISSQIETSLSSSQQLTISTEFLQSSTKDQFPLIVGIAAAVVAFVCSIFAGGFFYFRRLRKVKEVDGSSKEMDGTSYGYVSAKDEPIDRASVKSDHNYNQFPGKQRSHYDPRPSEPEPSDPNHYTSIDKVEQDHASYVDKKMKKAHQHYSEIQN